jgi:hypothetical protein
MYPPSKREALLAQLQAEAAIQQLTMAAYEYWLPSVQAAVDPSMTAAARPPDPHGVGDTTARWLSALDNVILKGISYLYGREFLNVFRSRNATLPPRPDIAAPATPPGRTPEPADPAALPGPARPDAGAPALPVPPRSTAPDQPAPEPGAPRPGPSGRGDTPTERTPADLQNQARLIVARILATEPESLVALEDQLNQIPTARELQSQYLSQVHNRMAGTPETVFRDITRQLDAGLAEGLSPQEMATQIQQYLGPETGDWPGRALTVARTESAGAMNSSTIQAAVLRNATFGEDLDQVWLATMDHKTRPEHFSSDGARVPLGGKFSIGTAELRWPGDPLGPPELTINCRCRVSILAADEALPAESGGPRAREVARRAAEGVVRARDDEDGVGSFSAAAPDATMAGTKEDPVDLKTELTALLERVTAAETAPAEAPAASDGVQYRSFTSVLAPIGVPTDDGRLFPGGIDLRFAEFPMPLMWQRQSEPNHFGSVPVGVLESASIQGGQIVGEGYLLNSPEADEAAEQLAHKVSRPSVDLADASWVFANAAGDEVTEADLDADPDLKIFEMITSAKLRGATLVTKQAFDGTYVTLGESVSRSLTAAAAVAELPAFTVRKYPDEFFADPGFAGPVFPQITADGRIMGHLASFNTCHIGIQDRCVMAPRSQTNYAHFHTSPPVLTEAGERVKVGRLTVGGGHASDRLHMGPAVAHYDDTGTCFALVHVGEDDHGIWFSGVAAPGATPEQIAQGLSAPLSGDWRNSGGNLELVAALAVNTPGFPIIASGAIDDHQENLSLIASLGPCRDETDPAQLSEAGMKQIATFVVAEMQASERRQNTAWALLAAEERRTAALALIQEVA